MKFNFLIVSTFLVMSCANPLTTVQKVKQKLRTALEHTKLIAKKGAKKKDKNRKHTKPGHAEKEIYKWFQTYSEVISLIEKKSFRKVDFGEFVQDSLKFAVAGIDAHSGFFTQKSYKAAMDSTKGEFSGIGVSVITKRPEDEALVIIDVIEGGPSFKAGLLGNDKILQVDREKLKGLSSDEVITLLKGKVGTKVKVKVIRGKKPMTFTITRDLIKDQTSVCFHFPQQNVYYLSLKIFNEVAGKQMKELLEKANDGKCKGIVLDLRRNPGGTLDSAIEMAGLFVAKDSVVVSTKDRSGKIIRVYKTKTEPMLNSNVPIFVLIDNFTASAAEILAGCLRYHAGEQDNLLVFLVGVETFGKGSVQELIPVKNGCALKLTTMLYYMPDDSSLQAKGIKPDFLIKPKIFPREEVKFIKEFYGKESSLKNHITVDEVTTICKRNKGKRVDEQKMKKKKSMWERWFGGNDDEDEDKHSDEEKDKNKKESFEKRQKKAISSDINIRASINLINLLHEAAKHDKSLVNNRKKALEYLKQRYLADNKVEVVKVR